MLDFLLTNDALSAIVAFVLVLIPAVLIHELGHFLVAKSVGITILEFGIGMPPRALKLFTLGGTDYTLNWLPLGGFVRPLGEDMVRQMGDEATDEDRVEAERRGIKKVTAVNEASPLARIFFFAGGALANFILAFALFTIIALIGLPQPVGGIVSVGYVAPNSVLAQAGVQSQDVIATDQRREFRRCQRLFRAVERQRRHAGDARHSARRRARPGRRDGHADGGVRSDSRPIRLRLTWRRIRPPPMPGLQVGDLILSMNGTALTSYQQLQQITSENLDKQVSADHLA